MISVTSRVGITSLAIGAATVICAGLVYRLGMYALAKSIVRWIAIRSFYSGYDALNPVVARERKGNILREYKGTELACNNLAGSTIEVLYLPSKSSQKTGNVLVICLNTTYQDHHPKHWQPFLENGADIVLWNPTTLGPIAYSKDLGCVLQCLRARNPTQIIALSTRCASADPGICVVADQKDQNIHLILDRGHGDIKKLARSFSILANLSLVEQVIEEGFNCHGTEKIKQISGKILFLAPREVDQVMDYGRAQNLTRDLYNLVPKQTLIELHSHDHWSKWDPSTYNGILKFLAECKVVSKSFSPVTEKDIPDWAPPSSFNKKCMPYLIKSFC